MTEEQEMPVNFFVSLAKEGDRDYVKQNLERRAQDVTFKWDAAPHSNIGRGYMRRQSYEKVFSTQLELVDESEPDFICGQLKVQCWREITPSIMPEDLAQHIERVKIYTPTYSLKRE